jgi:lysozyme
MTPSEGAYKLIAEFEGCRLKAYQDSVGIWTIGYGHTDGVKEGDTCTQEKADDWLKADAEFASVAINGAVRVSLTQNEFDALVAFVFNVGAGAFRKSTMLRKINDGDYDGAALEFKRWSKAGGKELAGLARRRAAEAALFETA